MGEGSGSGSGKTHAAKAHAKWAANGFTAACCQTRYKTREALGGALAVGGGKKCIKKTGRKMHCQDGLPVCVCAVFGLWGVNNAQSIGPGGWPANALSE